MLGEQFLNLIASMNVEMSIRCLKSVAHLRQIYLDGKYELNCFITKNYTLPYLLPSLP